MREIRLSGLEGGAGCNPVPTPIKPTLINWSRKYQFEIQNQRAVLLETLKERWLSDYQTRVNTLGEQLKKVEAELASRSISELNTRQLFSLADSLRRQIQKETGTMTFSSPVADIPEKEFVSEVQDWKP